MRDTELRPNTYKQGRAALTRLHKDKHYLDWLAVGNALAEARQEAKEACGLADTNMPDNRLGKAFAQAMSEILHREKMDSDIINTATRGQLSFIIEHLPDIEAWRKNELSPIERAKLNHPSSIYRHYRKYAGLDGGKKRENPAEKPTLLEETVALRGQVDALEQRIAEVEEERDVARGTVEQLRREATAALPAPPPTAAKSDDGSELFCSFCDKSRREVVTMISATRGFICSECVELCNTMLRERKAEEAEAEPETKKAAEYGTWRRARSKEEGYEHKCYFGDKHVATVWKADGGGWEWLLESNTGIGDVVETIADAKALAVEAALKCSKGGGEAPHRGALIRWPYVRSGSARGDARRGGAGQALRRGRRSHRGPPPGAPHRLRRRKAPQRFPGASRAQCKPSACDRFRRMSLAACSCRTRATGKVRNTLVVGEIETLAI